jgi:hypothetical protein
METEPVEHLTMESQSAQIDRLKVLLADSNVQLVALSKHATDVHNWTVLAFNAGEYVVWDFDGCTGTLSNGHYFAAEEPSAVGGETVRRRAYDVFVDRSRLWQN